MGGIIGLDEFQKDLEENVLPEFCGNAEDSIGDIAEYCMEAEGQTVMLDYSQEKTKDGIARGFVFAAMDHGSRGRAITYISCEKLS